MNSGISSNNLNGLLQCKLTHFVNLCLKRCIFWFITYLKHLTQVAYLCAKRLCIDCEKIDLEGGSQNSTSALHFTLCMDYYRTKEKKTAAYSSRLRTM